MPAKLLVLPRKSLYRKLFDETAQAELLGLGDVVFNETEAEWSGAELAERIGGVEVLVTGWGSARLTEAVLARATALRFVTHSAGSVKFLLDESLFARGVRVATAGAAMVTSVAEMTLMMCLLSLRRVHTLDTALRAGGTWAELKVTGVGDDLASQTVGVVGAGQVGRRVIKLLRAMDVAVRVFDPYYSERDAAEAGVTRCGSLDEMIPGCRIVTLHAPVLPETRHMMGAKQLAMMPDGGILINTARASLVDTEALVAELRRGRLFSVNDVFDEEPLPAGSEWRGMPNCIITPHIASYTRQTFFRQGRIAMEEARRYLSGQPLRYEVTAPMLKTMA